MAKELTEKSVLSGLKTDRETTVGFLSVTGGVCIATTLFWVSNGRVDPWQVSLLYLPVVVACAIRFGFITSVWGALLSFACWDYFLLSPRYDFSFGSLRDFIALSVFLLVAISTSHLASRARYQAGQAQVLADEARLLYTVSQVIARQIETSQILQTLTHEAHKMCSASACALLRLKTSQDRLVITDFASNTQLQAKQKSAIEHNAKQVILHFEAGVGLESWDRGILQSSKSPSLTKVVGDAGGLYIPLKIDPDLLGVMYVGDKTDLSGFSSFDERLLLALAGQASIALARSRMSEEATKQAQRVAILGERNRLAKEVHDTLSHNFIGIRFLLEAAAVTEPNQTKALISQATELAILGAQEARRSVWALRPPAFSDGEGLVEALRHMVQQLTDQTSILARVVVGGVEPKISDDQDVHLLRICQEAVSNVLRHSSATEVVVSVNFDSNSVVLSIKDNGIGFDEAESAGRYGLTNIRERSLQIGGLASISTCRGHGTEIKVTVPIIQIETS